MVSLKKARSTARKNLLGDGHPHLLLLLNLLRTLLLHRDVLALQAHDTATPAAAVLRVLVEGGREVLAELLELVLVLALHSGHRDARRGLLAHELAKAGLALDEAVRHLLLAAERREPDHQLQRVHIVRDDHELRLLALDERGD